jgi:hypothetical protein
MTLLENSERKFRSRYWRLLTAVSGRLDHPLQCAIAHEAGDDTASVAEWHSKFHAAARGIEATPLKKWMIP